MGGEVAPPVVVGDYVSLAVYSFTFLLGLPANLLVLFVYTRKARKRGATPNVVYALNQCLANLVLVFWLPIKAVETGLQTWALPTVLCPVYSFFLFASLYGSGLFLTAVAVGRYLSIAYPLRYKLYRRARFSCGVSATLWAIVLLHLGFALMAEQMDGGAHFVSEVGGGDASSGPMRCFENFTQAQLAVLLPLRLEMALLLFLLPLGITACCTLRCVALVSRSCLPAGGKRRVLAVALSTLGVFIACYAPYNVSHVVGFVLEKNVEWRSEAMLSSSCNVFLEPVVMLMLSPGQPCSLVGRLCGRGRGGEVVRWGRSHTVTRDPQGTAGGGATVTLSQRQTDPRACDDVISSLTQTLLSTACDDVISSLTQAAFG